MAFEITFENSYNLMPFLVLLIGFVLMMILLRTRKKMNRRIVVGLGLTTTYVAALTVMNTFLEYTLDVMHILSHVMFSAIILLCAKLLVTERVPSIFRLFVFLELSVFDQSQYTLAKTVTSVAGSFGRTQTGNLNFNMIGVIVGFITCLLLLFLGFLCF